MPPLSTTGYEYIPFDVHNPTTPPFKDVIKSTKDPRRIYIVQSCNGLLLCASSLGREPKRNYVYNPTTKQLTTLPKPRRGPGAHEAFRGITLAFDPARSPHYKVVCVRDLGIRPTTKYQVEIYSSETDRWKAAGGPFTDDTNTSFEARAYWNGAVHWLCGITKMTSLYFNVDEERLGLMPMLPSPDDWYLWWNISYFDESCGHLHLIDIHGPQIQFNVYEMKRDYSEWFVKHHVDLTDVAAAFPAILRKPAADDIRSYSFSIYSVVRGEKEEDAFFVLRIPGKAIRYNLVSKTFEKLCDFEGGDEEDYLRFYDPIVYPHIESLCHFGHYFHHVS